MKILLNISFIAILLFSSQALHAKISVYVPSELPTYKSVERLEAYGCALPSLRILAPLTHSEIFDSVLSQEQKECEAPEWLLIEREIAKFARQPGEARVRFFSLYDQVPLLGQEASAKIPFLQSEGRPGVPGMNLSGEVFVGSEGGQDLGFAAAVTPGFLGALDIDRRLLGRFYVHEGYVKVGYRQIEALYGRIQPEFGGTGHGGLFLSRGSAPQDMLKFSVRPHYLGSPFRWLGPFSFETWFSGLGESNVRPGSKLWANAVAIRPFTFLELGWLHAVQYGGSGVPSPDLNEFFKMFFYSQDPMLELVRRESSAFHLGLWGPNKFAKLYTQLFFNQPGSISSWFSDDMGFLGGIWFPRLGEGELRLEYVHTPSGLYSHSRWQQGWSLSGRSLGHAVGSDGEAFYLDLGLPPMATWRPILNFTYESRNRSGNFGLATEWRYGGGAKILKRWEKMEITGEVRQQSIYGFQYTEGDNRTAVDFYTELRYFLL